MASTTMTYMNADSFDPASVAAPSSSAWSDTLVIPLFGRDADVTIKPSGDAITATQIEVCSDIDNPEWIILVAGSADDPQSRITALQSLAAGVAARFPARGFGGLRLSFKGAASGNTVVAIKAAAYRDRTSLRRDGFEESTTGDGEVHG